mmetsp:Transcript_9669/g.22063  ORF Transcript_9669/g.22063 Transcript_9669/m.22063 type:complete len:262 (+) Transcript_9669:219-1004(+)
MARLPRGWGRPRQRRRRRGSSVEGRVGHWSVCGGVCGRGGFGGGGSDPGAGEYGGGRGGAGGGGGGRGKWAILRSAVAAQDALRVTSQDARVTSPEKADMTAPSPKHRLHNLAASKKLFEAAARLNPKLGAALDRAKAARRELDSGVGRPELLHCRVVVVRVRARPDWNGLLGCAVSFSRDEQRYTVLMDGTGQRLRLKPENLVLEPENYDLKDFNGVKAPTSAQLVNCDPNVQSALEPAKPRQKPRPKAKKKFYGEEKSR